MYKLYPRYKCLAFPFDLRCESVTCIYTRIYKCMCIYILFD